LVIIYKQIIFILFIILYIFISPEYLGIFHLNNIIPKNNLKKNIILYI
jgi:hypothetical protein